MRTAEGAGSGDSRGSADETATRYGGRSGGQPLTEGRRAATRMEIARAAIGLFIVKGVAATSAEEIAGAAGISVRTLWRYFPTKEGSVLPLLTAGVDVAASALRSWPPGRPVAELLDDMNRRGADLRPDVRTVVELVRLTRTEPGLRAVWLQAHDAAEPVFAEMLAQRAGIPAPDLPTTVQAAVVNSALRVAVEHYAFHGDPAAPDDGGLMKAVGAALATVGRGLSP